MQSKNKKKLIIANSSLLLFMIIGVVFAWFASNYNNTIDSNDVTVIADGALELSLAPDTFGWSNSIQLSNYEAFNNVKFTDITGSGDGKFSRPTLQQNINYASVATNATWTEPKSCNFTDSSVIGDYVKFTLYMRSKDKLNVYLGADSSVEPVAGTNLKGAGTINKSPFSTAEEPFSRDLVVGAVRVSACDTGTNNRLFTWIPRPDIYVDAATSAVTYNSIYTNVTNGPSYNHQYYDSTTLHNLNQLDSVVTKKITDTTKQSIASLAKKDDKATYYEGSVDFYIWLEGCDNEARRAFVDGQFKVNLNISAVDA